MKQSKESKVFEDSISNFNIIAEAQWQEREMCRDDRRFCFVPGAQWEGAFSEMFNNKPMPEINKVHLAVIRIISEYQNNRITVDYVTKDGTESDDLADVCDGLYRADEQDSNAQEAYDNAFLEACSGGIGAWRLRTSYEDESDEESEYQRIVFEPIYDADTSVYFDANSKKMDKSDATMCWVITQMSRQAYTEQYNDDPTDWPKPTPGYFFDWYQGDVVYIAEYYKKEETTENLYTYKTIDGKEEKYNDYDFEQDDDLKEFLAATNAKLEKTRKIKKIRVHKYIMSGGGILEDCGYIAGPNIPVVMAFGKRTIIDGIERAMGHVRLAKDPQRIKNMQMGMLGQLAASSPIEKPIMIPQQIAGHELMWQDDNIENYPYLLVNPVYDVDGNISLSGPIGYTKTADVPPALATLLQLSEMDIQDILGNQQQADKMVSNISGKAVEMIQQRVDMQTFIYLSNFAKAMKRCGEIWLGMAREVYVEEGRKMKSVSYSGSTSGIELVRPVMDDSGEIGYENDMAAARFDVSVDVGPSTNSKRESTLRTLTSLMAITQDPQEAAILSAMAVMNMDGEGIGDLKTYQRKKLVSMGVIQPSQDEKEEMDAMMANQQPSAQDQYLAAAAQRESASAQKAQADTVLALAKSEQTKADTVKTLSEIKTSERESVMKALQSAMELLQPRQQAATDGPNIIEQ